MNEMKIRIVRESVNSKSITGSIYVDDKYIGCTLELPYRNNEKGVSAIPEGSYGTVMRYDKNDGWRIQLTDTEPRTGVQIHKGNSPSEIKGCVLVGTKVDEKNNRITGSKEAYAKLKEAWGANDQCPAAVSVEIKNKPPGQCTEDDKNKDQCTEDDKDQNNQKEKDNKDKDKKDKEDKDKKDKDEKDKKDKDENKDKKDKKNKKKDNATMPAPDNGSDPCPTGHHVQNQPMILVIPTLEEMLTIIERLNTEAEGECGMKTPENNQGSNNPEDTPKCASTGIKPVLPIPREFDPLKEPPGWCGMKDPHLPLPKAGSLPFFRGSLEDSEVSNNKGSENPQIRTGFFGGPK